MHEMSLTASLINIIKDYAARNSFSRVNTVSLSFGKLSGIDTKALEFAFEVLSKDTPAEGARLIYEIKPIGVCCLECDAESEVEDFPSPCRKCGSNEVVLTAGTEELQLLEMDVD